MAHNSEGSPVDELREERLKRQVEKIETASDELRTEVFDELGILEENYRELLAGEEDDYRDADRLERAIDRLRGIVETNTADIETIAGLLNPETVGLPGDESDEFTDAVLFALSEAGEIVAEIEYVESLLRPEGTMVADGGAGGGGGGGLLQRITNWLKSIKSKIVNEISGTFWDIVSAHRNARSWTINGEAGFGMMGLSGTVGVGVTFE